MLKKILGTVGTRYVIALLNLALIFINAKVLGVQGVGLVGLIIASMNIAVIFNGIFSGSTLVYFMNRYPVRTLLWPAYGWTVAGSALACAFMQVTGLLPVGYALDVYLLAVLNSLVTANARFLLGKDDMKGFNLTYMLQGGLLFFILLYFYYVADRQNVESYLFGVYLTNGIALVASLFLLRHCLRKQPDTLAPEKTSFPQLIREMFVYGLWASADNLAEVLTTRLNYFFVQRFAGLSSVGLLDAGTKISESVWHISRSVSFITYSQVAKTTDETEQKRMTLQLFKFTFVALALVMGLILCLPEWIYTRYLFSPEFAGIRLVVIALSPGIVALGCNSILCHFFIGSGRIRLSTYCSCSGLLTLLIAGYLLIPVYGVTGAAVSTSIAFLVMLTFSLIAFTRATRTKAIAFLPNQADIARLKEMLRSLRK